MNGWFLRTLHAGALLCILLARCERILAASCHHQGNFPGTILLPFHDLLRDIGDRGLALMDALDQKVARADLVPNVGPDFRRGFR